MWAWACEHEQIYLEYFNDMDKFLKISLCHIGMMWKIFFHVYMDESPNWMKCLDERFIKLKCIDEIISKQIISNENHMYMDESYKKHEILGWVRSMNDILDDNWK